MSANAFNRISALEQQVRELLARVAKLEKSQACEPERPHTLTLNKRKADPSHA
jgi:hypothetical protein